MSLPYPFTGPDMANVDPKLLAEMDAPLIALTNRSGGDLRSLLSAFFSFLNRRTDFYLVPNEEDIKEGVPLKMGFREGDAEKLLLAAFRQFPLRRMPRMGGTDAADGTKAPTETDSAKPIKAPKPQEQPITSGSTRSMPKTTGSKESSEKKTLPAKEKDPMEDIRLTEEGLQVPVGNGGTTKRYTWTQTIDEATVLVAVPEGTKGKDLSVTIKASSLSVRMKKATDGEESPRVLLDGELIEKIRPDESMWSLEGGVFVLTLDKLKKTWWETVLTGDDKIDTTLVDSRRHINEYDDSTQAAIRKILFDQRQQRLGKPTSDEMLRDTDLVPPVLPLPDGVEFIDQATLDKHAKDST